MLLIRTCLVVAASWTYGVPMSTPEHPIHAGHAHEHRPGCHAAIQHQDHVDYIHDGHLHHPHGDHVDEHVLEVDSEHPAVCTPTIPAKGTTAPTLTAPAAATSRFRTATTSTT